MRLSRGETRGNGWSIRPGYTSRYPATPLPRYPALGGNPLPHFNNNWEGGFQVVAFVFGGLSFAYYLTK